METDSDAVVLGEQPVIVSKKIHMQWNGKPPGGRLVGTRVFISRLNSTTYNRQEYRACVA